MKTIYSLACVAVLLVAGCGEKQPSYAELLQVYEAEQAELERLEKREGELIRGCQAAIQEANRRFDALLYVEKVRDEATPSAATLDKLQAQFAKQDKMIADADAEIAKIKAA